MALHRELRKKNGELWRNPILRRESDHKNFSFVQISGGESNFTKRAHQERGKRLLTAHNGRKKGS